MSETKPKRCCCRKKKDVTPTEVDDMTKELNNNAASSGYGTL